MVSVASSTGDLHVGLVDPLAIAHGVPARAGGLGQQWRERLHPAVDGDVVDLDPALGEELLDVAVGQPEAQVPADRQNDDIARGKRKPAKVEPGGVDGRERSAVLMAGVSPPRLPTADATEPCRSHLGMGGMPAPPSWGPDREWVGLPIRRLVEGSMLVGFRFDEAQWFKEGWP
jgi:hypothetical protein